MSKANLSRRLHTQVSEEEGALIEQPALDDDRWVSAFIRLAVLRDAQYQETAKRAKAQFRKTMVAAPSTRRGRPSLQGQAVTG